MPTELAESAADSHATPNVSHPWVVDHFFGRLQSLWLWPVLLALVYGAAVSLWLHNSEAREAEERNATLITDALSLENKIADRLTVEQEVLQRLANTLPAVVTNTDLILNSDVNDGLRNLWISITALDSNNRVMASIPDHLPASGERAFKNGNGTFGVTAHLTAFSSQRNALVARIDTKSLLQRTVPWWLSHKYDVRIVDGLGQLISSTSDDFTSPIVADASHRISLEPILADSFLQLSLRGMVTPWYRTLPMALLLAFVFFSGLASWSLRVNMRELRTAEQRWRKEAAWRRAIEDSLTVGLRARDMKGQIIHVNRAFCDLTGFSQEQLIGCGPQMPYWPADTISDSMQRMKRNLSGGAPREGYESKWVRSDGKPIDVMIFESPLIDEQGEQVGWMGSIVDITIHKQSQDRERHQAEELAYRARFATLGEIASALAHQLNQPLAAISGYSSGLLKRLDQQSPPDPLIRHASEQISQQALAAGKIVQHIRDFLMRRSPQREPIAAQLLMESAIELVKRNLQRRAITLTHHVDKTLPLVEADLVLIEQVLINLISNAADAMDASEAHAATAVEKHIHVSATLEAATQQVRFEVRDNGPGLRGRDIVQLCTPFYSTKSDGMGLGLSICRSVIEAHYGHLHASSPAEGGALFYFTLPVATSVAGTHSNSELKTSLAEAMDVK